MSASEYDRQAFVKSKEAPPPPWRPPLPVPGVLLLFLVAALAAFAAYWYVKVGGVPSIDVDNNTQVKTLEHKVEILQARLDKLKKRQRLLRPKSQAEGTEQEESVPKPFERSPAELAHLPKSYGPEAPAQKTLAAAPEQLPANPSVSKANSEPSLNLLRDFQASQQEWEAMVNRLGRVVGELNEQRALLMKNQNDVNQLSSIRPRTGMPFTLKRGLRFQRLGPISVRLSNTDVKNQRYTLRMIVDDKPVELKDRAVNEVIQFYTAHSHFPAGLVVSEIERGHVSGMLSVPNDLNAADQDAQMR